MYNCINIYSKKNIDELQWPKNENALYAKKYILPMIKDGVKKYISNLDTEMMAIKIDDIVLPVTLNKAEYKNSYVCSPYTHYITYSLEELNKLNNFFLESCTNLFLNIFGFFMKLSKVNKVICVNNWMLSTNLYVDINKKQLERIENYLKDKFKGYAIIFRSINGLTSKEIYSHFVSSKWLLIGSRSSYIYFPEEYHNSNERCILRRDRKLKDKSEYYWKEHNALEEIIRLKDLYEQLYLDKYSMCNPQFTEEYIKTCIQEKLLTFYSLCKNNKIYGVIGFYKRNGVITTPFFGYDLSIERKEGIYRILSLKLFEEAKKQKHILHLSSGAGEFKRCRGGKNVVEYSAVCINHLSIFRKIIWYILDRIVNCFAMPLVVKKKL